MPATTDRFLEQWHAAVNGRDHAAMLPLLAEDVAIGAPPYWSKIPGRPVVHHLLGLIVETVEDFTYRREWVDGNELALEFVGHVEDIELQGIDLITLNGEGLITNLDVLMRPIGAIEKLQEIVAPRMMEFLGG